MAFIDVTSDSPNKDPSKIKRHTINSNQIYRIDHLDESGCIIFFAVANAQQTMRIQVRESADAIVQRIRESEALLVPGS